MKLYRFSPIKSENELLEVIKHIHFASYKLCKQSLGFYLPNAGNVGVFCHYDDEYKRLTELRKELTVTSNNLNQKYYRLHKPITIPPTHNVPETTYTYLYVRKPDPYRHHVGDIDFYLEPEKYEELKTSTLKGKKVLGARVFERPGLDMIELYNPDVDVLAYVSTEKMSEAVKVKLSEHTKL
ncbi:hypothetical protein KJ596_03570 [Patescibacteria group bacterium]|nr:hypothetical protein [Patescibacteria group bacterium]MBU1868584.1 hypothetical protein [Patescibacteria group bacterium]